MAKKHKNPSNWWITGAVILIIILMTVGWKNNPVLRSISDKLNPPTPTITTKIIPPESLKTDQAVYVKMAADDLQTKLKIKKEDIKVISVKATLWNDSSLGCPQKGMIYVQSITSGYSIELFAKGKTYIYNAGLNRIVSC